LSEPIVHKLFAERIGGANYGKSTAIYKFEKIKRAKAAAKKQFPERALLDLGVGEPDEPAFPETVRVLQEEAGKPENRFYTDNGIAEFKQSAARYMKRLFGVDVDAETEVLHSIGSKSALSILPACFINPGDLTLMTAPGYPVFGTHAKYYGGEVLNLPLLEEKGYLPDLDSLGEDVRRLAKVLVLNYPNNPTGAAATPEFFAKAVDFCRENGILLIHDAAYASLIFDGKPTSVLNVPGAKDVAIELHSLSKSFNMTGWRIGWVCGNPLAVRAYGDVKDNSDSGQFAAIQKAAAYCLDHSEITTWIANKYSRRMDSLVTVLKKHGFRATKPKGSFFLYVGVPKTGVDSKGERRVFKSGEDFSQFLITEHLVSTVPWDDVGPYVRWSVTYEAANIDKENAAMLELDSRLRSAKLEF
jgi:LL-diaminopimelate aminotransferase